MKKILLLILWVATAPVFAQKVPFFRFEPKLYPKNYRKLMFKNLRAYAAKMPQKEQLKIVRGILKNKALKSPGHYKPEVFGEPNKDEYMDDPLYWVFDFNQDKTVDLVLIFNTYFGPTSGYYFYFNNKGKFEYAYDNSGDILFIKNTRKRTILQYVIPVIDNQETQIIQTFVYNHARQTYLTSPKVYYASQTVLPDKLIKKPKLIKLKQASEVRFSPKTDNTPVKQAKPDEYIEYKATKTLKGNVVASYDKGAKGYLLATKEGWGFVAFLPDTKLIKTSLRHGMDEGYNEKTNKITKPEVLPYICGWVPGRSFR